jgi:hypothetical protein
MCVSSADYGLTLSREVPDPADDLGEGPNWGPARGSACVGDMMERGVVEAEQPLGVSGKHENEGAGPEAPLDVFLFLLIVSVENHQDGDLFAPANSIESEVDQSST